MSDHSSVSVSIWHMPNWQTFRNPCYPKRSTRVNPNRKKGKKKCIDRNYICINPSYSSNYMHFGHEVASWNPSKCIVWPAEQENNKYVLISNWTTVSEIFSLILKYPEEPKFCPTIQTASDKIIQKKKNSNIKVKLIIYFIEVFEFWPHL